MASYDFVILLVKTIIIGIAFLLIVIFVVKPLLKGLSEEKSQAELPQARYPKRYEEEELEIPTSKPEETTNEAIVKMAKKDPLKTTQLVRNWIHEKK